MFGSPVLKLEGWRGGGVLGVWPTREPSSARSEGGAFYVPVLSPAQVPVRGRSQISGLKASGGGSLGTEGLQEAGGPENSIQRLTGSRGPCRSKKNPPR